MSVITVSSENHTAFVAEDDEATMHCLARVVIHILSFFRHLTLWKHVEHSGVSTAGTGITLTMSR